MTNIHKTQNFGVKNWVETPFAFEHAMAGYIMENPQLLALNDSTYSEVKLKRSEAPIGRKRADLIVSYTGINNAGINAIVELKNVTAKKEEFDQIDKYLSLAKQHKMNYSIGVLVAPDFDYSTVQRIKESLSPNNNVIYGIKIMRFECDKEYIVITDVIYPNIYRKDYTRYTLNAQGNIIENLSKAQLAWNIVNTYIMHKPNISFEDVKTIFSDRIQNRSDNSTIHLVAKEEDVSMQLKCRYSKETIILGETNLLVSNQWNLDSIQAMIEVATKQLKMNIK